MGVTDCTMVIDLRGRTRHWRFPSFQPELTRFTIWGMEIVDCTPGTLTTRHWKRSISLMTSYSMQPFGIVSAMVVRMSTPMENLSTIIAASMLYRESARSSGTPACKSPICIFGALYIPKASKTAAMRMMARAGFLCVTRAMTVQSFSLPSAARIIRSR